MFTYHATDVVAYQYQADVYCPDCIGDVVAANPAYDGWKVAEGVHMSAEDNLNEIAAAFGIDRDDEESFDSGDFPKVVFASDASDDDCCGACLEGIFA